MTRLTLAIVLAAAAVTACTPASRHAEETRAASDDGLSVGTVQREIRHGMTGDEVVSVLGAPNIVTSNAEGGETWVWDRVSTEQVYSRSSGGVSALFLAGVGSSAGASATRQRTLTVIVKFDGQGRVNDFSYRQSAF